VPGLDPGIDGNGIGAGVDGRVMPGHDDRRERPQIASTARWYNT
jgi:hypothetical protein